MGCGQTTELPDSVIPSDLAVDDTSPIERSPLRTNRITPPHTCSFEAVDVDLHTLRTSDSSNTSLGKKTHSASLPTRIEPESVIPAHNNIPLEYDEVERYITAPNEHHSTGVNGSDDVLFVKVGNPTFLPPGDMVHFQRPVNADHHGAISNPLVMPPPTTNNTHTNHNNNNGGGGGATNTNNRLDSERIAAIQERLLRSANSAHSQSSGGGGGGGGGGASSCPQTRISSSSFSGNTNGSGAAPATRGSSSSGGGGVSNTAEVTKTNSGNGNAGGHQRSVLVPTPPWAMTRRNGGTTTTAASTAKGPPQLRRVYQSNSRGSGNGLGNSSQENLLEPSNIVPVGGGTTQPSDIPVVETLSPPHPAAGGNTSSSSSSPSTAAAAAAGKGKPPLIISSGSRHPSIGSSSLGHPPTTTPPPPAPVKKMRPVEEDFLSDISSDDTPSLPSSSRNSPTSANRRSSARGHKGDEIEQERNRMPLNIEEDLFVYDDIVISKDEARTKHWRLAGRKSGLDGNSRRGSVSMNSSSSAASNTTNFSFNDFDVCVDEMDVAPSSSSSAAAVKVLLSSLDNPDATPGSSQVLSADMSVTWTQPRRQHSGLGASTVSGGSRQVNVNGGPPRKLTDRPIKNFTCKTLRGHATRVKCISLSPSEKEFVSCSNEDASVMLNSFTVGDEVGIFTSHQETVICTAFSPDGKLLATSSKDRSMKLWDVMTTKLLLTYNHSKVVICCCFSPDSRYVVSGCQDRVCRLWDTRRGKEWLAYSQHEGIIISVAFSPDSNYICSASADSTLRVWTSTTAKTKFTLTGHQGIILSCSYTSDGAFIISNDESQVRVWSTVDGSCQLSLSPDMLLGSSTFSTPYGEQRVGWTLSAAAPGAFTNYILVACNNRFVYVIDRRTGEEVLSTFCKAPVYCLSSGWNELVACGDSFGNIYVLRLM